jgi:hydroxymethylpyrimidine/phosphomethylpyrimidine kinase
VARALTALTIGPLEPGGRDGVLADLSTFSALGLHGAVALTAIESTALPVPSITSQLGSVLDTIQVDAVKLTCPGDATILDRLADALARYDLQHLVVDPAGAALNAAALDVLTTRILPIATIVLPNLIEAQAMAGLPIETWEDMCDAASAIAAMGAANVAIKGGKRAGDHAVDLLFDGVTYRDYTAGRVALSQVRGAGTTFAAAVAATLAKGETAHYAVATAKAYVTKALQTAYDLGGEPALHHFYRYWRASAP